MFICLHNYFIKTYNILKIDPIIYPMYFMDCELDQIRGLGFQFKVVLHLQFWNNRGGRCVYTAMICTVLVVEFFCVNLNP